MDPKQCPVPDECGWCPELWSDEKRQREAALAHRDDPHSKSEPECCAGEGTCHESSADVAPTNSKALFKSLSFLDRYLAVFVFLAMVVGVLIGVFAEPEVRRAFDGAEWEGVSIPILIGLLVMIWPPLAKVQWERLPDIFRSRHVFAQLGISFALNWIIAPFVMLGLAWATLPDLERERKGVLLVGVARCIAMVLIWNAISKGNETYCAILVVFNSLLQVVLFSPYAVLFCNILGSGSTAGGSTSPSLQLEYGQVAKSVGIYLGIPLGAGALTRLVVKTTLSAKNTRRFFDWFGPVALIGLLYTIIVLFANQGKRIVDNIGTVFRISVPLVLYFTIVWTATFFSFWAYSRKRTIAGANQAGGYENAVTQAFTAGSNNFELAIAVAVASFGVDGPEVLAATLGPLIEVPVLLMLSYVALWLRQRLVWSTDDAPSGAGKTQNIE